MKLEELSDEERLEALKRLPPVSYLRCQVDSALFGKDRRSLKRIFDRLSEQAVAEKQVRSAVISANLLKKNKEKREKGKR